VGDAPCGCEVTQGAGQAWVTLRGQCWLLASVSVHLFERCMLTSQPDHASVLPDSLPRCHAPPARLCWCAVCSHTVLAAGCRHPGLCRSTHAAGLGCEAHHSARQLPRGVQQPGGWLAGWGPGGCGAVPDAWSGGLATGITAGCFGPAAWWQSRSPSGPKLASDQSGWQERHHCTRLCSCL
jgi:hypothetical protein